jgi:poly(glycerol-phosphate) alpha-glucosyltransferase
VCREPADGPVQALCSDGDEDLTVMFLNLDMKRRRTGIENASLMRARMFERELGIVPHILTVNYDAHFLETRDELLRDGFVTKNTVFRNLYDWFQEMDAPRRAECPAAGPWKQVDVPGTPDVRLYDDRGTCIMYRKCSRDTGVLEYINYFCQIDGRRRKWRRDTYTPDGTLSRIQYVDPVSAESLFEHYLRPDGSVAIIQLYELNDGKRKLKKISLMGRAGECCAEFAGLEGFIEYWLRSITADPQRRYVMVSDKNRFYYRPVRKVRDSGCGNIAVVAIIHAVHTKNGFNIRTSGTNINYADILNDLAAQDAVVVATDRQRRDITDRYGPGNLHVIPHAFRENTSSDAPTFHERERTKVIYVGRYSEEKNHPAAVRAFVRVVAAVPEATLHMYGSGSRKSEIEALVASVGMERNIFVHDYATDVASLYRSAGLSLLTSKGEGYALVIMESLCHGCPVVAFDVNYGPADMIRDGKTGALVPFNDEEALASAVGEILNNPQRHEQMCDDALESACEFGIDVVAAKWRRLLQELPRAHAARISI